MAICSILISAGLFYGPNSMVMAAVFLCYFVFNMGAGVVPWYYISEVIPSYSLGAATVLCCSLYWIMSIATGLMVPLIENSTPQWLFVVFGSFMLFGFFVVMLFVPETVDCPVADVVKKHSGNIHLVVKLRSSTGAAGNSMGGTSRSLLDLLRQNVVGWIGGEQHSQTLAALLHASQIWRFAVLPRVCRDVAIDFTSSFRPVTVRYSQWPIMNSEPDIGLVGLVRTAAVQLNLVGIIDGSTTAELLKSAERHVVYSKARELKYTVYFAGDDNDFKMLNASKPITKFLRMIEQMLPNARSVAVELKS
ncbi:Bifunctional purine biosynthesis protein PurH [Coemansia sp. RSA 2706]|nr:Bifunctional purine biosynthesis protein PurH [Coemansia sp. RSA 2706]